MNKLKFSFIVNLLMYCLLLIPIFVFAEENPSQEKGHFRLSAGAGIPYGILGANLEVFIGDYFSLAGGAGITPVTSNFAAGGSIYLVDKNQDIKPRLSAYYGTIGYNIVKEKTYKSVAFGIGCDFILTDLSLISEDSDSVSFDFIYSVIPEKYKDESINSLGISFGYGIHF